MSDVISIDKSSQDDSFGANKYRIADAYKGFDKFSTIDSINDDYNFSLFKLNSKTRRNDRTNNLRSTINGLTNLLISSSKSWLVLSLIGITIGSIAAIVAIIAEYLNSLKNGYCSTNFYLNKSFCCWGIEEGQCDLWKPWSLVSFFNYLVFVILSISFAITAGYLVQKYGKLAAGSGISEVKCIVSGFHLENFLTFPTLSTKALTLPLVIASGLSVGKEGPSVHYAAAAGYCVNQFCSKFFFTDSSYHSMREYIIASSAAGVAVAFGSPIGGVLFGIEEITSNYKLSTLWKCFFCSLVATSTLSFINPYRAGQLVIFEVEYDKDWHFFEIPFFVILGIFGGIYGIICSKFNIIFVGYRQKYLSKYPLREILVLSSVTSIICYFNEYLRLDMTEAMEILFHECGIGFEHRLCNLEGRKLQSFLSLVFATIVRVALTIVSYGSKVPCGIFVPSMATGATFGRALGIFVENLTELFPKFFATHFCKENFDKNCTIIPGTYAFLGAAAALSGITDLTITVVVIMFELTGALRYILPTMIVVTVTKVINDKWGKGAISDQMIRYNGLPFLDPKEDHVFNLSTQYAATNVSELKTLKISSTGDSVNYDNLITLKEFRETFLKREFKDIPITYTSKTSEGTFQYLAGFINRTKALLQMESFTAKFAIENAHKDEDAIKCNFDKNIVINSHDEHNIIDFSSLIDINPITVNELTPLETTYEIFLRLSPRTIFVVDKKNHLKGILTKKDIAKFEIYLEKLKHVDFNLNALQ